MIELYQKDHDARGLRLDPAIEQPTSARRKGRTFLTRSPPTGPRRGVPEVARTCFFTPASRGHGHAVGLRARHLCGPVIPNSLPRRNADLSKSSCSPGRATTTGGHVGEELL